MPTDIEDFREPKFIKPKPKYPFGENKNDKFLNFATRPRSYRGKDDTPGFKQPGYNPDANVAVVREININKDDLTLPPR